MQALQRPDCNHLQHQLYAMPIALDTIGLDLSTSTVQLALLNENLPPMCTEAMSKGHYKLVLALQNDKTANPVFLMCPHV